MQVNRRRESAMAVLDGVQILVIVIFSVLVITNIVGNTLVCAVIIKNKDMRTPMNYLLVNLAVADILVAVFIAPQFILIHTFKHPDGLTGTLFCKFLTGGNLMWAGATASAFTLVVIAFERYYAVIHPYGNDNKMTNGKLKVIIPAIWIFTAFVKSPSFLTTYFNKEDNFCTEHWPEEWMGEAYSLATFVLLGGPIIFMIVLYSRVVYSLWIKEQASTTASQKNVINVRKRVTKMVVAVSILYILFWTPDLVIYALILFTSELSFGGAADIISIILVVCNSTVNPFIYAYVNVRFRRQIKELLGCKGERRNRRGETTEGTSTEHTAQATVQGTIPDITDQGITLNDTGNTRL